jgi:hypothetical protein
MPLSRAAVERRLCELQPDAMRRLDVMRRTASEATDPAMLELCRLRLAQLLHDDATDSTPTAAVSEQLIASLDDWRGSQLFNASQRAHLAFAEQFSVSVADVSDEDVALMEEYLSDLQIYEFAVALYVVELEMRLRRVAALTLAPSEVDRD